MPAECGRWCFPPCRRSLTQDSTSGRAGLTRNAPDPEADHEAAALREKLHQLEAQSAAERREAFEAGRRQGDQQARAELLPVLERLNASIAEIVAMRPDLRRRAERDVVQLALLIARRVLHRAAQRRRTAL